MFQYTIIYPVVQVILYYVTTVTIIYFLATAAGLLEMSGDAVLYSVRYSEGLYAVLYSIRYSIRGSSGVVDNLAISPHCGVVSWFDS